MDRNIGMYMDIVRGLKNPIWTLTRQNEKFGTGFDLWRTGENRITLELMDGCAKNGKVIHRIDAFISGKASELSNINALISFFETAIFDLQETPNDQQQ